MKALSFNMQRQLQSNWCWAATSASVSAYFGTPAGPAGTPWQQCQVASSSLNQSSCCQNGSTPQCNQDWYLERGLNTVSHLAGPVAAGASSFAYIKQEVDAGRPVGVRIGWNSGGGHFLVLTGYDDTGGQQLVEVEDPWYGASTYDLNTFATAYQSGQGHWTHTYPIK